MEPVCFNGCWGFLHLPDALLPMRGAVILCNSVGRESRYVYRPLWILAERLAAQGFAVLRYDHVGTGESLALSERTDAWSAWLDGLAAAANKIRKLTGARFLVVGGVRLGASLAGLMAKTINADALMLLAPAISGRAWLRELYFATKLLSGKAPQQTAQNGLDTDGIWLAPKTLASLAEFNLGKMGSIVPHVFLSAAGGSNPLPAIFRELGARVMSVPFLGYEELFKDAYLNALPEYVFREAEKWLSRISANAPLTDAVKVVPEAELAVQGGVERAVCFGQGLRGILCLPSEPVPERKAVLFCNTGADPRSGIGGFATDASRALCRRGIASLRFDFAGIGDSAFSEDWRSHVYETPRDHDYSCAISVLDSLGIRNFVTMGVCSGAFHAFEMAFRDERIAGFYSVNATILTWKFGDPLEPPPGTEGWGKPWLTGFKDRLLTLEKWQRLLKGEIRARTVLTNIASRLNRRVWARLDSTRVRALRRKIRSYSARGGQARVLVGSEDNSLDELETHFGRAGRWLANLPGMTVRIVDGIDHGMCFRNSREMVIEDLAAFAVSLPVSTAAMSSETLVSEEKVMGAARTCSAVF